MAYPYQGDLHKRKATGGKKSWWRKKRKYELGREPTNTKVSDKFEVKIIRVMGGNHKVRVKRTDFVNVYIPEQGKSVKAKIIRVVENPAHREAVRMQLITKGAIVETDIGLVKITSRPGQDGTVNGILIQAK